jgi:hypothetical protein
MQIKRVSFSQEGVVFVTKQGSSFFISYRNRKEIDALLSKFFLSK